MPEIPYLLGVAGAVKGRKFVVTDQGLRLGREVGNEIHVDDNGVSRQHARFILHNGGVWVQDVGSRNGVFVNDERVQAQRLLKVGDQIKVGRHLLEVGQEELQAASAQPEQAAAPKKQWRIWPFAVVGALLVLLVGFVAAAGNRNTSTTKAPSSDSVVDLLRTATDDAPSTPPGATVANTPKAAGNPSTLAEILQARQDDGSSGKSPLLSQNFPAPPAGATSPELVEKGHSLYRAGRLHDALVAYHQAQMLDPNCEICALRIERLNTETAQAIEEHFNAGLQYYNNLQYPQAINEWEMVLLLSPDPESQVYKEAKDYLAKAEASVQRQY